MFFETDKMFFESERLAQGFEGKMLLWVQDNLKNGERPSPLDEKTF